MAAKNYSVWISGILIAFGIAALPAQADTWIDGGQGIIWSSQNTKIGLGFTPPGEKLDIQGTMRIFGGLSGEHTAIKLRAGSSGGDKVKISFLGDNEGDYANIVGVVTAPASGSGTPTAGKLVIRTRSGGSGAGNIQDQVTITETGSVLFGTGGAGSASYSISVAGGGGSINSGNGRSLTIEAGTSDNASNKIGGHLVLRSGAPVSPATTYGNIVIGDQGGKVGVGTATPQEKMHVAGNLKVDGVVKVGNNGWSIEAPDYVFENDYKLAELAEVEGFIKKNKHLPEIPSARQMEKDGMNLAEMNLRLLKKIEELTLHAIKQEKRIESQNGKIRKMEVDIARIISTGNAR